MDREWVAPRMPDGEEVWSFKYKDMTGLLGDWTIVPDNIRDPNHPHKAICQENRLRALAVDRELERDGFLRGVLGELLDGQNPNSAEVLIIAGHSRSGKTSGRQSLERSLAERKKFRPCSRPTARVFTIPWLTLRDPRTGEHRDKNLDRIQSNRKTLDRLIEEDFGRTDKQILTAVNTAYSPYVLPARSLVGWGISPKISLEYALRHNDFVIVECSPDVGIALKRILHCRSHLMLVMSRDRKAAGYPRPGVSRRKTSWRQLQSDLCWQLLLWLVNHGRAHWMFDSITMPMSFSTDELVTPTKEQIEKHSTYVGGEVAGHAIEALQLLANDPNWRFVDRKYSPTATRAFKNYHRIEKEYITFVKAERALRAGQPLPPPLEDPSLAILNIFRQLPEWGLLCPGRRDRSHWI